MFRFNKFKRHISIKLRRQCKTWKVAAVLTVYHDFNCHFVNWLYRHLADIELDCDTSFCHLMRLVSFCECCLVKKHHQNHTKMNSKTACLFEQFHLPNAPFNRGIPAELNPATPRDNRVSSNPYLKQGISETTYVFKTN